MNLTNLLDQAPVDHSDRAQTLTDTLRKHAKDLTDADLTILVAGLREQRTRWNAAQASGSKERVTSAKVSKTQVPEGFTMNIKPRKITI